MELGVVKTIIKDIRTYSILSHNENYKERLKEAYDYIKNEGITSLEDFQTRKGLLVGAFTYDEMTIFDRLQDEEYAHELASALFNINNSREAYIENPHIGDELASWGKLGYTPYRDQFIQQGYIVEGLTPEEQAKIFK